jgi:hypothetical protein
MSDPPGRDKQKSGDRSQGQEKSKEQNYEW